MTIAVAGATGQLGRRVIESLFARGVAAGNLVAAARDPTKAAGFAARGVQVREADYHRPDTLRTAFAGVRRLLLISASDPSQRIIQHRNVIDAANAAGVELIAYTSALAAQLNPMIIAADHKATEYLLEASGLPYAVLRNAWYTENYTQNLDAARESGVIFGSAGDGRIAGATRADFAEAAGAVLTTAGSGNAIYELGGDEPFTMTELAAEIARQTGEPVSYRDLPVGEYVNVLVYSGLPAEQAAMVADSDLAVSRGFLSTDSGDLRRLIGRPTTPLAETIAAALAGRPVRTDRVP
jgi:NAD(P)H dehydrogenase (quinone)